MGIFRRDPGNAAKRARMKFPTTQPVEGTLRWRVARRLLRWAVRLAGPWLILGWVSAQARHQDRQAYVKVLRHLRMLDKQDRAGGR